MGRFTLALGYVLTGDRRYLHEYNDSFKATVSRQPYQPMNHQFVKWVKQNGLDKPAATPTTLNIKGRNTSPERTPEA